MPSYTTEGKIHSLPPKEQRGNYTIAKVVLDIPGYKDRREYPSFEFFGGKSDAVDQFQEGDSVSIKWELSGRENKGRYYTTLSAFQITHAGADGTPKPRERKQLADRNFNRPAPKESRYSQDDSFDSFDSGDDINF